MNLPHSAKKFLCQIILHKTGDPDVFDEELCESKLRREATDWLFIALSVFTYIYLAAIAVVFFGGFADEWRGIFFLLDTLQDPYLGALGIYVILKEIRQRRLAHPSRYLGELFVVLWAAFGTTATILVFFLPQYGFDEVYKIILINSSVVFLIFIGSLIHR